MITSNDLANRLGVSRATVLRAVARGQLRPAAVTPGGHRRFSPEDVEAFASFGATPPPGLAGGLVSSKEAARLLGVSQQTVSRAVREGQLRAAAVTPGGHRRFSVSEIFDSLYAQVVRP